MSCIPPLVAGSAAGFVVTGGGAELPQATRNSVTLQNARQFRWDMCKSPLSCSFAASMTGTGDSRRYWAVTMAWRQPVEWVPAIPWRPRRTMTRNSCILVRQLLSAARVMKNITITLDEKTAAWVRIYAAEQGMSVSRL